MKLSAEERKQIENEMLFRRINEKAGQDLDILDQLHISDGNPHLVRNDEVTLQFKCECSNERCEDRISMRLSSYKDIHTDRSTFIILPNHEIPHIETVVAKSETYSVVKKNHETSEPEIDALFNDTGLGNPKK